MAKVMNHQEFIEKCNEFGEVKKNPSVRFDTTARSCGKVEGFTPKGLSFLASLLSDENTASGQLNEKGEKPDKSKQWSMDFLAEFNPEGHLCSENPSNLRDFARQLSEGKDQFEPFSLDMVEKKRKSAILPSPDIVSKVIKNLQANDEEITDELIFDEIEDYYDDNEMTLPQNWQETTRNKIKQFLNS